MILSPEAVSEGGSVCTNGCWLLQNKDALYVLRAHQMAPRSLTKDYLAQNVNSAKAEKLDEHCFPAFTNPNPQTLCLSTLM